MQQLTAQGEHIVQDLAQRYGVSTDAVITLLMALRAGHGTMAQFQHPELGGPGQWMHGGMTMVSDLFNHVLKAQVDGICTELSRLLAQQVDVLQPVSHQAPSQSQGGGAPSAPEVSLFAPPTSNTTGPWWPAALGRPSSTGAQDHIRYAYFPAARRLAIDSHGHVTVYDTLEHQISGVSQQQSAGASLTFTSQLGVVQLASLPVVSVDGVPAAQTRTAQTQAPAQPVPAESSPEDVITTIERLAALKNQGVLSEEEFAATKAALLKRL